MMIFWLVLKLEISYYRVIIFELCALPVTINYLNILLCYHEFMSMLNLILINIHFMDMKRRMLIYF
jgi:hypothetical protein